MAGYYSISVYFDRSRFHLDLLLSSDVNGLPAIKNKQIEYSVPKK